VIVPAGDPAQPLSALDEAGRERVLALLREHYAQGRLNHAELDRRVGIVLSATYTDEAAATVADLPTIIGASGTPATPGAAAGLPIGQRRRHATQAAPSAAWVPTPERFRDPSTKKIMRVWIDPADQSRHYVPDDQS
jgi:Domain of unknown function (DUF1707)